MLKERSKKGSDILSSDLASPVLKWAGGKSQLLPILFQYYPNELRSNKIDVYIEPFVGGGAVFFDLFNKFNFQHAFLIDINPEIITLYQALKSDVDSVIDELSSLEKKHLKLGDEKRKQNYYEVRDQYNSAIKTSPAKSSPARAAQTIFLNRTCFNGLYRVNSKGHFNVPMGRYKNPTILFEEKLRLASKALQIADLVEGDFTQAKKYTKTKKTFVYYDPPYRPISQTAQFTSYSSNSFDDNDQRRLAGMYKELHKLQAFQMLSNSDPTNYAPDPFFDTLYKGFNIHRINATRRINSDSSKRGEVRELLITNYKVKAND